MFCDLDDKEIAGVDELFSGALIELVDVLVVSLFRLIAIGDDVGFWLTKENEVIGCLDQISKVARHFETVIEVVLEEPVLPCI